MPLPFDRQGRRQDKWLLPKRKRRAQSTFAGFPSRARVTQAGRETIITATPTVRVTQQGRETIVLVTPVARITQAGVEVILILGTTFTYFPQKRTAAAKTLGPTVQIVGSAVIIPVRASAIAKTLPGTNWSVTIFGALARAGAIAQPVPDPSFDVRPGSRRIGARTRNPWLGAPFNANDSFASATVIPDTIPYTVRGSTSGFTTEAGESGTLAGTSTGWYTYTPSVSGFYEISLLNSEFNTTLTVYTQSGSGVGGLVPVASNDDLGGTTSHVYVYLTAGTQYWIRIGGPGGVFQLDVRFVSALCQPAQCGGSITTNFWMGWSGTTSPSIVGGFGGSPEICRARCSASWNTIHLSVTLDSSNHSYDQWYMGWEIHDINDRLLGGRGNFFTGPQNGLNSWQDKLLVNGVGSTSSTVAGYSPSFGGDTSQAYWFVFYAFPTNPNQGALTGSMHALAFFVGSCQLPPEINPIKPRTQAWWT